MEIVGNLVIARALGNIHVRYCYNLSQTVLGYPVFLYSYTVPPYPGIVCIHAESWDTINLDTLGYPGIASMAGSQIDP